MNKYLNKTKNIGLNILNKGSKLIDYISNKIDIEISVKGFSKKPIKYIFYIVTIILPLLAYFLLRELKGFTILLISFSTFLIYINLCIFQNLCIVKVKNSQSSNCKLNINDLKECISFGFGGFILLWLSRKIFDLFSG